MSKHIEERLDQCGFSAACLPGKIDLFDKAMRGLLGLGVAVGDDAKILFVPGRIELLGKHTDYAGGRSLLCATELGICLVASPRTDQVVRILDTVRGSEITFTLCADLEPVPGRWSNYPMTVARRIARNFPVELIGADIAFASDLPPAAGLSSSSALIVAFFIALAEINLLDRQENYRTNIITAEDLAGYLGTVENGQTFGSLAGDLGVGTFGGSQDHTAILCCRPGELSQYSFCPISHERSIRLPEGLTFVIGVSGVVSDKTGGAKDMYNRAARMSSAILQLWRNASGQSDATLADAINHDRNSPALIRRALSESSAGEFSNREMIGRFEQFFIESFDIIPAVSDALACGRIDLIGQLVDRSQRAAERYLGNQVAETIELARSARRLGAIAASAFGAGFGGSVWAMVEEDRAEDFRSRWAADYRARFPALAARAQFFSTQAGPAVIKVQ